MPKGEEEKPKDNNTCWTARVFYAIIALDILFLVSIWEDVISFLEYIQLL